MPDLSDIRAGRAAAQRKGDMTEAVYGFLDLVEEFHKKGIPLDRSTAADHIARIRAADRKVIEVERQDITFNSELV